VVMLWFGFYLWKNQPQKVSTLPKAAVDTETLPPEPRLEAIEDLRHRRAKINPPRAADYYAGQEKLLQDGDPAAGVLPAAEAIKEVASKLRVDPKAKEKSFPGPIVRLPSKASSGRAYTGGQ